MRIDEDKDYKLEWRKAMDELVNLRQEYRELKEDRVYIKSLLDAEFKKGVKLKKENKELKLVVECLSLAIERSFMNYENVDCQTITDEFNDLTDGKLMHVLEDCLK